MNCHECARSEIERPAVGLRRFCFVGVCKVHLVASFRSNTVPQYGCSHDPGREFPTPARPTERLSSELAHATR